MQARADGGISSDDKVPFIMPVFLIERPALGDNDHANALSSYLWNTNYKTVEALSEFYKIRAELTEMGLSDETHYLIAIGKQFTKNQVFLGSFGTDPDLQLLLDIVGHDEAKLNTLLQKILALYAYFYSPVEADASAYSA